MNIAKKRYKRIQEGEQTASGADDDNASLPSQGSAKLPTTATPNAVAGVLGSGRVKAKRRGSQASHQSNGSQSSAMHKQSPSDAERSGMESGMLPFRKNMPMESATTTSTSTSNGKKMTTSASRPAIRQSPSKGKTSFIKVSDVSFDIDEDDDDDVLDQGGKHYKIEFSTSYESDAGNASLGNGSAAAMSITQQSPTVREIINRFHNAIVTPIWFSFQSSRQEARQRRAQRLLEEAEDTNQRRAWMCMMTSCDNTDRGLAILAGSIFVWSMILWSVHNHPKSQHRLLWLGIALILIRVTARPIYNYATSQQPIQRIGEIGQQRDENGKPNVSNNKKMDHHQIELATIDESISPPHHHPHHDPTVHCV